MSNPKKPTGVELDATLFAGPAELATLIREHVGKVYVDGVWVKCGRARHRITPESCDAVCRGLLIASEMASARAEPPTREQMDGPESWKYGERPRIGGTRESEIFGHDGD